MKVGHHGSSNATTVEFLTAVDPEIAIIQCGLGNDYGHPHQAVLNMLNNHGGVNIYRTDTNGTITVSVDVLGGMDTVLTRTDMTYNNTSGDNMPNSLQAFKQECVNEMVEVIRVIRECCFLDKRTVL